VLIGKRQHYRDLPMEAPSQTLWTIGHSTRSIDEFLQLLHAQDIELLIDVRRFPGSRRLPHFASEALATSLERAGIGYLWLGSLGGRRKPGPTSVNDGWRHPAFRAYADHIDTEEFASGLFELLMLAGGLRTTIMCSEVLWWRCHRRLISDVAAMLGYEVIHIRDQTNTEVHRLAPPTQVVQGMLSYAAPHDAPA
jgi:uncharacterized protein (DUF488 family)